MVMIGYRYIRSVGRREELLALEETDAITIELFKEWKT